MIRHLILQNDTFLNEGMIKTLLKGSSIYGIAPFIPRILSVLLLPIMTEYLTAQDYGIIGTVTSILFALQAFQALGLQSLLPTYYYKCPNHYKVVWKEIYGFLSIWMIVFALLQTVVLYFFIPEAASDNRWIIIILSVFSNVFFGPTAIIGQTYYQLKLQPVPVAYRAVLSGFITILSNFVCVVWFHWGYLGAYVGTFAGTFFVNASYWPVVNRKLYLSPIFNFKKKTIIGLLRISLPTIPHYYSAYLMNSSNTIAMNYFHQSQSEIGKLSMSQNFSNIFDGFINAINQVFSPMQYKYIKEEAAKELKRMTIFYILLTYFMTVSFSLWSKEIYKLLIHNEDLTGTYIYSVLLVMGLNYRPIYVYSASYFFYHENTKPLLMITFAAGLISCLVYFSLTQYLGIWAAVLGFYIGCLYFGYSGQFFHFYKTKDICGLNFKPLLWGQVIMTIIVALLVNCSTIYKLLFYFIFLSAILFIFIKTIRIKDSHNLV